MPWWVGLCVCERGCLLCWNAGIDFLPDEKRFKLVAVRESTTRIYDTMSTKGRKTKVACMHRSKGKVEESQDSITFASTPGESRTM